MPETEESYYGIIEPSKPLGMLGYTPKLLVLTSFIFIFDVDYDHL